MKKSSRYLLIILIPIFTYNLAYAYKIVTGSIKDYGIYSSYDQYAKEIPPSVIGIKTISNTIQQGGLKSINETHIVPLKKNTIFGYKFKLSGFYNNSIQRIALVTKHPPMISPEGKVKSEQIVQYRFIPQNNEHEGKHTYILNRDYEMVPGSWTFEVWHNQKRLINKTFTLILKQSSNKSLNMDPKPLT